MAREHDIDPLLWAESVGLSEIVARFPEDIVAAYRDVRRDLEDLPKERAVATRIEPQEKPIA